MWRLQQVTDSPALKVFCQEYQKNGGFPLNLGYLLRAKVMGIFDGKNRLVGGFVINENPPFRALNDMPEEAKQTVLQHIDSDQTFEMMCFWLLTEYRKGFFSVVARFFFMLSLFRTPKKCLLTCTVSPKLLELYQNFAPVELYRGQIALPDGTLPKHVLLFNSKSKIYGAFLHQAAKRLLRRANANLQARLRSRTA